jgi:Virulence protein RhuM family
MENREANNEIIIYEGGNGKPRIEPNSANGQPLACASTLSKGFTMDDERLKGTGGGHYWKELLERIRDIRSSEKALYRQVLETWN